MHPGNRAWQETLRRDRQAVILADRLGYHDAFIGEHLTDRLEISPTACCSWRTLISEKPIDPPGHRNDEPFPHIHPG